jgi:streptogramin lyase
MPIEIGIWRVRPPANRRRSLKAILPASVAALALLLPGAAPGRATAFGFLNEFGTAEAGKLGPVAGGVVSDADGDVYVVDAAANRIVKYDFNGRFITAFGGSRLRNAAGLASDGKNVYVVDAGHSRVLEFDGNGVLLRSLGHAAVGPGQLVAPVSVAVGKGGRVYVTDDGLKRVVVFASDGRPAGTFGSISHPFGIAVAPVGNVWVTDYSARRLYEFTSGGRAIRVVSAGSSPRGAASDSAGDLYVADSSAQKVLTFNANGVAQGSFGVPGIAVGQMNSPTWVATDCRGNVYVIDTATAIGGEFVSKGLKYGDPAAIPPPCLPTGSATGTVLVNGAPFTGGTIPYRSNVDVTNGTLDLSTETGQLTVFGGGGLTSKFQLVRASAKELPLVDLRLIGGNFSACGSRTLAGQEKKRKPIRRLWGKGKGRFRTKGRFSSASVRGTTWLTEDRCDGTLTLVRQGVVSVYDQVKKKTITVRAGRSYLAKPKK